MFWIVCEETCVLRLDGIVFLRTSLYWGGEVQAKKGSCCPDALAGGR